MNEMNQSVQNGGRSVSCFHARMCRLANTGIWSGSAGKAACGGVMTPGKSLRDPEHTVNFVRFARDLQCWEGLLAFGGRWAVPRREGGAVGYQAQAFCSTARASSSEASRGLNMIEPSSRARAAMSSSWDSSTLPVSLRVRGSWHFL